MSWDRYTRKTRRHREQVVRLHGGPRHGKIVQLTLETLKRGHFLSPVPVDPVYVVDASAHPPSPELYVVLYRRYELAWFDDVENTEHLYDYWKADEAPLPPIGLTR